MKLLKDAYGEVLSASKNDPVDDLGDIKGAIMDLYHLFSTDALSKHEDMMPNRDYNSIVEQFISGNHFTTIECLKKINEISKKYHDLTSRAARL